MIKMVYTVGKNFAFSLNAVILVIICYALYYYLIRKKLLCIYTFRLLDRVA